MSNDWREWSEPPSQRQANPKERLQFPRSWDLDPLQSKFTCFINSESCISSCNVTAVACDVGLHISAAPAPSASRGQAHFAKEGMQLTEYDFAGHAPIDGQVIFSKRLVVGETIPKASRP
ncbi:hypothetical protein XPA_007257 [Xanthoria parietina]